MWRQPKLHTHTHIYTHNALEGTNLPKCKETRVHIVPRI